MSFVFMSRQWAQAVGEAVNAGPAPDYRATKLEDYWGWIEMAKLGVNQPLALAVRDLPSGTGADGDTLLLELAQGVVTGVEVGDRAQLEGRAAFLLAGDHRDWVALLEGYDVGKTVMYRKLMLEVGDILAFFAAAYYWVELLARLVTVPVALAEGALS